MEGGGGDGGGGFVMGYLLVHSTYYSGYLATDLIFLRVFFLVIQGLGSKAKRSEH